MKRSTRGTKTEKPLDPINEEVERLRDIRHKHFQCYVEASKQPMLDGEKVLHVTHNGALWLHVPMDRGEAVAVVESLVEAFGIKTDELQ